MKNRKLLISTILAVSVGVSNASVSVDWQSTGALSVGESVIDTSGILAYAYNTGAGDSYIVNGVLFAGTATGGVGDLNGDGNVIFNPVDNGLVVGGFSSLSGDFGSLMGSAQWGSPSSNDTITLGNLTDGDDYLVQIFTSDNRSGRENILSFDQGTANEFDAVSSGSSNSGAYVTGIFTADSSGEASFTFGHKPLSGNANINAIQVRNLTVIPEPSSMVLFSGLVLACAQIFRRRRNV